AFLGYLWTGTLVNAASNSLASIVSGAMFGLSSFLKFGPNGACYSPAITGSPLTCLRRGLAAVRGDASGARDPRRSPRAARTHVLRATPKIPVALVRPVQRRGARRPHYRRPSLRKHGRRRTEFPRGPRERMSLRTRVDHAFRPGLGVIPLYRTTKIYYGTPFATAMEREVWIRGAMVLSILALMVLILITPSLLGRTSPELASVPLLTIGMSRNESAFIVNLGAVVQAYQYDIVRMTLNGSDPSVNRTYEERDTFGFHVWVPENVSFSVHVYLVDHVG